MKILVTGGAGFIGTNFVHYMAGTGNEITVLDKLTYAGRKENIENLDINFIHGDIASKDDVKKASEGAEAVINFAAETHVDNSIRDPSGFLRTNVFGVFNLLEASRSMGIKKFLQVSTDEVYGPIENGSFVETDRLATTNPYSASKAAAEHLCFAYHRTYGIPVTITRSSNNFGPHQHQEKLIPMTIVNSIMNRPITLFGDGSGVRDWIYVKDNCMAIRTVLEKGRTGEIYNIAAGNEKTNLEVVKLILNHLNKPESLIKRVPERPGHDIRYSMVCDKIKRLGWAPRHTFEDALRSTIDWYLENKQQWSAVAI